VSTNEPTGGNAVPSAEMLAAAVAIGKRLVKRGDTVTLSAPAAGAQAGER
jgi:hypothetical protein